MLKFKWRRRWRLDFGGCMRSRDRNTKAAGRLSEGRKRPDLKLRVPGPAVALPLPLPPPRSAAGRSDDDVDDLKDLERIKLIGYGSGGKVYKVRHVRRGRVYALKVVHGNHDLPTRRHIVREAEILKRADSPYVVKCHGVFDLGGEIQFVLEYMEGGSLADAPLREVGPAALTSEAFLSDVARPVLEGLRYLHRQRIVHRDVKPSNLLLNGARDRVKIADFGVSRILSKTVDPCNSCVGTYAYMSPERIDPDRNGGQYDGYAGDIWSLGLTLLECYIGRFPFLPAGAQADWPTLMYAICYGEPPAAPPTASQNFQSFVGRCLQKDAARRWTASQLLAHPFVCNSSHY